MMSGVDWLNALSALLAVVAAFAALWRMRIGPSVLDRTVAMDVLTAAGIGLIAVMIVWWKRADLGVLLVILALTAFMTAVTIARFAVRESQATRRILTEEEAERQLRQREEEALADEEAELERAQQDAAERAAGAKEDHS